MMTQREWNVDRGLFMVKIIDVWINLRIVQGARDIQEVLTRSRKKFQSEFRLDDFIRRITLFFLFNSLMIFEYFYENFDMLAIFDVRRWIVKICILLFGEALVYSFILVLYIFTSFKITCFFPSRWFLLVFNPGRKYRFSTLLRSVFPWWR